MSTHPAYDRPRPTGWYWIHRRSPSRLKVEPMFWDEVNKKLTAWSATYPVQYHLTEEESIGEQILNSEQMRAFFLSHLEEILYQYEVTSSWWVGFMSTEWLRHLAAHYFVRKAQRKRRRGGTLLSYAICNALAPNHQPVPPCPSSSANTPSK